MPYVPKPPKGKAGVSYTYVPEVVRESWNNKGERTVETVRNSILPNQVYAASRVNMRSSNKPRKLVPQGTLWKPCSNYAFACETVDRQSGILEYHRVTDGRLLTRDTGPSIDSNPKRYPPSSFVLATGWAAGMSSNTRTRLGTEVMLKVADRKTNYGEALGEAKSTARHLASTVKDLVAAYKAARRGNFRAVANILKINPKRHAVDKSAGSRWLEYQYGWVPLLSDIYDSVNLIQNGFRKEKMIWSEVRGTSDHFKRTEERSDGKYEISAKRTDVARVYFSIKNTDASRLANMGLINPLEVAWAVMPYSFVVDWFLPVGNFLEALTAQLGVDFIDGYYGERVDAKVRFLPEGRPVYQGKVSANTQWITTEFSGYNRNRMGGFPRPGLYLKNPFSETHLISALALIRQLTK